MRLPLPFLALLLPFLGACATDSSPRHAAIAPAAVAEANAPAAESSKNTRAILNALKLSDPATTDRVRLLLDQHFAALSAWHRENDRAIAPLWTTFDEARTARDTAAADAALDKIAAVYAGFRPVREKTFSALGALLTPEQIEAICRAWAKG
jgi:hypothetical protein